MTGPVVTFPLILTVRSAVKPLKSFGQRAVFSNACRMTSRALGSSATVDCGVVCMDMIKSPVNVVVRLYLPGLMGLNGEESIHLLDGRKGVWRASEASILWCE